MDRRLLESICNVASIPRSIGLEFAEIKSKFYTDEDDTENRSSIVGDFRHFLACMLMTDNHEAEIFNCETMTHRNARNFISANFRKIKEGVLKGYEPEFMPDLIWIQNLEHYNNGNDKEQSESFKTIEITFTNMKIEDAYNIKKAKGADLILVYDLKRREWFGDFFTIKKDNGGFLTRDDEEKLNSTIDLIQDAMRDLGVNELDENIADYNPHSVKVGLNLPTQEDIEYMMEEARKCEVKKPEVINDSIEPSAWDSATEDEFYSKAWPLQFEGIKVKNSVGGEEDNVWSVLDKMKIEEMFRTGADGALWAERARSGEDVEKRGVSLMMRESVRMMVRNRRPGRRYSETVCSRPSLCFGKGVKKLLKTGTKRTFDFKREDETNRMNCLRSFGNYLGEESAIDYAEMDKTCKEGINDTLLSDKVTSLRTYLKSTRGGCLLTAVENFCNTAGSLLNSETQIHYEMGSKAKGKGKGKSSCYVGRIIPLVANGMESTRVFGFMIMGETHTGMSTDAGNIPAVTIYFSKFLVCASGNHHVFLGEVLGQPRFIYLRATTILKEELFHFTSAWARITAPFWRMEKILAQELTANEKEARAMRCDQMGGFGIVKETFIENVYQTFCGGNDTEGAGAVAQIVSKAAEAKNRYNWTPMVYDLSGYKKKLDAEGLNSSAKELIDCAKCMILCRKKTTSNQWFLTDETSVELSGVQKGMIL